jgi:hypothetical protein
MYKNVIPQGGGGVVPGRSGSGRQQAMRARTFSAYQVCHVTITFLKIIFTLVLSVERLD